MKTFWFTLIILAVPLSLAGCGGGIEKQKSGGGQQYEVKGQVVAVAPDKQSVTLDHEEIAGLMKAMKMGSAWPTPRSWKASRPGIGAMAISGWMQAGRSLPI